MVERPLILVTGTNGQLGSELKDLAVLYPAFSFFFADVQQLDITNTSKVESFFLEYHPAICINAAAYTAVDKAETERELAMQVNAMAVGVLAQQCRMNNARFIHISTDYVFNGNQTVPYKETDDVDPVNFYGFSKLQGELLAFQNNPSSLIIRTSWVYSRYGNNFVKTMVRLLTEKDAINVINDQIGSPTYAADLAEMIMQVAVSNSWTEGVYHYSNEAEISWFDFAVAIKKIIGSSCNIHPITSDQYPTAAKRPHFSLLDKSKIESTLGIQIRPWIESLEKCLLLL